MRYCIYTWPSQEGCKPAPEQRCVQLAFRCTSAAAWNTKLWSGRRADRRHVWTNHGIKLLIQVWFKNQQNKGANQCLKDVAQTQQQRPELPMVTFTWHARKYREHIRYYRMYLWWSLRTLHLPACQVRVTIGNSGLCCRVCVTSFEC